MKRSGFLIIHDQSGKAGLVDAEGREVVPCIYDKILDYDNDGYIRLLLGGLYGTIDCKGQTAIPHQLGLTHLGVFHQGSARAQKDGRWGLVDEQGKAVTDFSYLNIEPHNKWGYKATNEMGQTGMLSENGHFAPHALHPKFREAQSASKQKPTKIAQYYLRRFSPRRALDRLQRQWWQWAERDWKFYYRDTDFPPLPSYYKPGNLLRCGRVVEVFPELLRPAHRYRLCLACKKVIEQDYFMKLHILEKEEWPYGKYSLPPNAYFGVYDVVHHAGITQILLLQLPYGFVQLAQEEELPWHEIDFYKPSQGHLKEWAYDDLLEKLAAHTHGHSLLPKYQAKMHPLLGLDEEHLPFALQRPPLAQLRDSADTVPQKVEHYYDCAIEAPLSSWKKSQFVEPSGQCLKLMIGDIAQLAASAIVSPLPPLLNDCSGVAASIFGAASSELRYECQQRATLVPGDAFITASHGLLCRHVIHCQPPQWKEESQQEEQQLAACYDRAMQIAEDYGLKCIAFPCIGTGAMGFPPQKAAQIAIHAIKPWIEQRGYQGDIIFCCFTHEDAEIYTHLLTQVKGYSDSPQFR